MKIKILWTLLLLCGIHNLFAQQQFQEAFKPADMVSGKLDNGLQYYIMHNEEPKERVSFYFAQNVGSILEDDTQQGLAHFLEHMAFNGTAHFSNKEMLEYLQKNGMQFGSEINAFTSFDETVYNINKVPVQNENLLDSVLLVLYDWSAGLTLIEEEIDNERGVIREEWRSRNTPMSRASDKIFKQGLLKGSKYENRFPIGLMEIVDNFHYNELREYYKNWYRPDQQAIVVVGDVDVKKIEAKIKERFSDIPLKKGLPERVVFDVPINDGFSYLLATDKELGEPVVQYYIKQKADHSFSETEDIAYGIKLQLARYVFNNRLSELSRDANSPVLSSSFSISNFVRPLDVLSVSSQPKKDNIIPAVRFTLTELKRFMQYGATPDELLRAKAAFKTSIEASIKNSKKRENDAYAGEIYRAFFKGKEVGDYLWNLQYRLAFIETIQNEDIISLLDNFNSGEKILGFTGTDSLEYPKENEILAVLEQVDASEVGMYEEVIMDKELINQPLPGASIVKVKDFQGINGQTYTLSNGARITLFPTNFDKEQVYFQAFSPGGKSLIDEGLLPNAMVTSILASESGIGTMSKIELNKYLQGKQTSLVIEIGDYSEGLGGSSTLNDLEVLMQRIYLAFTEPRFDNDILDLLKLNFENSLTAKKNNVQSDFRDSLQLAQSNFNSREIIFKKELIEDLSIDKIQQIYKDRIRNASDFDFVFVGDFETETFMHLAKKYIGSIRGDDSQESVVNHNMRPAEGMTPIHLSREMETPQTTVNILLTGDMEFNRENNLLINVIGQLLSKRYLERIREAEGGSYGVQAYGYLQNIPEENYVLNVSFNCNPDKTEKLVEIVFDDIKNLAYEINTAELNEIKSNLKKGVVENREKNAYWLKKIVASIKNEMPLASEKETLEQIESVSSEKIKALAAKINDNPRIVEGILTPIIIPE
ncbi:M16 family metallopeptidase [Anditalea andensis]|uniref:Peptidase M16 n=1 Tax=Anditalea andensis TaxID=1048983 RepID=A0A074LK94_9BACT|nr:M16 family metallopeptidase [Anditalea andensis]KEO74232.1 hypothetical protein EL17_08855 [Anditalea andensis]